MKKNKIEKQIEEEAKKKNINMMDISVREINGVVFLEGVASSYVDEMALLSVVFFMPEIKEIVNKLNVRY